MILEVFERDLGDLSFMSDFEVARLHIVCVGVNALTFYNSFATHAANGITHEQAGELASIVNQKNEAGTLWPKLPMTILPQSVYGDRNDFGHRQIMRRHIKDAIKANEEYSKCPQLIFALERNQFDLDLAYDVLKEIISDIATLLHARNVYYVPF
jgi:hypothetical protein